MRAKQSDSLNYIEGLFTHEEDCLLKKVYSQLSDNRKLIQVSPVEGKILYMLIKMNMVENIVEVGTLAGYSALWMARAIPSHGKIYTIENNNEHAKIAKRNFSEYKGNNITLLEGDAIVELGKLQQEHKGPFDMIFIDADKGRYCDYLDWAEHNIKNGGLIVGDNTLLFDTVFLSKATEGVSLKSWQVMKKFNERLSHTKKYDSIMLPTTEGLIVAIKK